MDTIWKLLPLGVLFLCACASRPPVRTVDHVDLPRYMGDWYVAALMPWFAEKGHVNTMDIYKLRDDGTISVTYAFRKKSLQAPRKEWKAKAWVHDKNTNAHWKIQFLWPFAADFLVIYLSPDYRSTVVAEPSGKLAWIMSRSPQMPEEDYRKAVAALQANGFDTSRLEKVLQPGTATQ